MGSFSKQIAVHLCDKSRSDFFFATCHTLFLPDFQDGPPTSLKRDVYPSILDLDLGVIQEIFRGGSVEWNRNVHGRRILVIIYCGDNTGVVSVAKEY